MPRDIFHSPQSQVSDKETKRPRDADLDANFQFDADSHPSFPFDADPDSDHHQKDADPHAESYLILTYVLQLLENQNIFLLKH